MTKITTAKTVLALEAKLNELNNNPKATSIDWKVLNSVPGKHPEFVIEYKEKK